MKTNHLLGAALGAALCLGVLPSTAALGASARAAATCDGRVATIEVPATTSFATEPVVGTPGDDVIVGTDAWDTIDGAGGNDVICGLGGFDKITGGDGDDRLFGGLDATYVPDDGYLGDVIAPGPGNDFIDLGADPQALKILRRVDLITDVDQISYAAAAGPISIDLSTGTATGEGTDTITAPTGPTGVIGSAFDDTIVGTDNDEFVAGGAGNDAITTADGNDLVKPDLSGEDDSAPTGDDVVDTGVGNDIVESAAGRDTVTTGAGRDYVTVQGRAKGTKVNLGGGNDSIWLIVPAKVKAGAGDDDILVDLTNASYDMAGGAGRDEVSFNTTKGIEDGTRVVWDNQRNRLTVAGKNRGSVASLEEVNVSGPFHWTFQGSAADESIAAASFVLSLTARTGGGDDVIYGSHFADLLDGGPGRDRADGNQGRDTCVAIERSKSC